MKAAVFFKGTDFNTDDKGELDSVLAQHAFANANWCPYILQDWKNEGRPGDLTAPSLNILYRNKDGHALMMTISPEDTSCQIFSVRVEEILSEELIRYTKLATMPVGVLSNLPRELVLIEIAKFYDSLPHRALRLVQIIGRKPFALTHNDYTDFWRMYITTGIILMGVVVGVLFFVMSRYPAIARIVGMN